MINKMKSSNNTTSGKLTTLQIKLLSISMFFVLLSVLNHSLTLLTYSIAEAVIGTSLKIPVLNMHSENKSLLKLVFSNGYPDKWNFNIKVDEYVTKLGDYRIEDLSKEMSDLQMERNSILENTQELAISNYRTFIETAECSRKMFSKFNTIDEKLNDLLTDLPNFEKTYEKFSIDSSGINNLRKLNSLTLTKNAQLLEILELPQLMHSLIDDGLYDDALELTGYVRKINSRHPDIPIFKNILNDVEKAWFLMLHQLLNHLRQELTLPKCLQIVGHLRRMNLFSETELRLKFLQARNCYLQNCLKVINSNDANHHLNKTIEVTRVNLFNIITQYRAIFSDDEYNPVEMIKSNMVNQNVLFFSWIMEKVHEFLATLKEDLSRGVSSIDSILGQCMYFGLSFSKVGCDFRPLLVPIFTRHISQDFQDMVSTATINFEKNLEKFTLINKNHPNVPWKSKTEDPLQPPDTLLEFYPLAEYLNSILSTFNKLRLCAPISIIDIVTDSLQESLLSIAKSILTLYTQEKQAFSSGSKDAFTRLCMAFSNDLLPYLQKCLHIIFPPSNIAAYLGINLQTLQNEELSFLNKKYIIKPIKHLLPIIVEPILKASIEQSNLTQEETESKNFNSTNDENHEPFRNSSEEVTDNINTESMNQHDHVQQDNVTD